MNLNTIKFRKSWSICPVEKVHSTPKGLKGYDRSGNKQVMDDTLDDYKTIKEMETELDLVNVS